MRSVRAVIAVSLLALACLGCMTVHTPTVDAVPSLIGSWERAGEADPFAGMQVRVERSTDGSLCGVIVELPESAATYGFAVGNLKWKDIQERVDGTYALQDLSMEEGEFWWDMILEFAGPDEIHLRDVESQGEIGAEQRWRRFPPET